MPNPCDSCKRGYFSSGIPGVLAHVVNKRIRSKVEHCDFCEVYASDAEAYTVLIALGFVNEFEQNSSRTDA